MILCITNTAVLQNQEHKGDNAERERFCITIKAETRWLFPESWTEFKAPHFRCELYSQPPTEQGRSRRLFCFLFFFMLDFGPSSHSPQWQNSVTDGNVSHSNPLQLSPENTNKNGWLWEKGLLCKFWWYSHKVVATLPLFIKDSGRQDCRVHMHLKVYTFVLHIWLKNCILQLIS